MEVHLARSNRAGTGLVTTRVAADQPERWRKRLTGDQVREIGGMLRKVPRGLWSIVIGHLLVALPRHSWLRTCRNVRRARLYQIG